MRCKLKLDKRKSNLSKNGRPLVVSMTQDSKIKIVSTGYYSFDRFWDDKNALPKKKHPNFLDLLNFVEDIKPKLRRVEVISRDGLFTFDDAKAFLFDTSSDIFYNEAIKYVTENKMHPTYRAVLIQFEKYFPQYYYDHITEKVAKEFSNNPLNGFV